MKVKIDSFSKNLEDGKIVDGSKTIVCFSKTIEVSRVFNEITRKVNFILKEVLD
ncbi:hypothetical protein KKG63_03515 [Patescibacteria group bacterium]|nr:hypothetical protein [Patescibacteria group bacterium]